MRWTGKLALTGIVAMMALPTAYTFQQQPVVAGHTTYASMDGLDPCIAGIVGVVRLRVMWFNDQVLFERASEDGGSWIYAVQGGAPDPRDAHLLPTGQEFRFADPNGAEWHVVEYNFTVGPAGSVDAGKYTFDPGQNPPARVEREPSASPNTTIAHYYTWVVQTGPSVRDDAATGRTYNFVDLVDTCKFTQPGAAVQHANDGGNWTSTWNNDTTHEDHLPGDATHGHERYTVDLYVGKAPRVAFVQSQDPEYLGVPT